MNLRDIILTANANLARSKVRTGFTVAAIFIGAFTLTLTNGLGAGINDYVDRQVNNLGQDQVLIITGASTGTDEEIEGPQPYNPDETTVESNRGPNAGSVVLLTDEDIEALESYRDIEDVQPSLSVALDYISGPNDDGFQLNIATVTETAQVDLAAGTSLGSDNDNFELLLPLEYVEAFGYDSADEVIGLEVELAVTDATDEQRLVDATVVGIMQEGLIGSDGAIMTNALLTELYDQQSQGLPEASRARYAAATATITAELTDENIDQIKLDLEALGYDATTVNDQLGAFTAVITTITYVLNAFAVITLLAASFGIVNTLYMSVQERTKEIGLMKAMGMRSRRIFLLFSLEATLIGLWGSVIGLVVAIIIGNVANQIAANTILEDLPGFDLLIFPADSLIIIAVLIMGIAFAAGTLPARRASRLNPIDALRYE